MYISNLLAISLFLHILREHFLYYFGLCLSGILSTFFLLGAVMTAETQSGLMMVAPSGGSGSQALPLPGLQTHHMKMMSSPLTSFWSRGLDPWGQRKQVRRLINQKLEVFLPQIQALRGGMKLGQLIRLPPPSPIPINWMK
jgi:hypothetical protein